MNYVRCAEVFAERRRMLLARHELWQIQIRFFLFEILANAMRDADPLDRNSKARKFLKAGARLGPRTFEERDCFKEEARRIAAPQRRAL